MGNDFSNDSNCKALWKLESGALTTDSKGTNTLTNSGVSSDLTNYKEGAGSGDWESTQSDYMSIADASLSSGFPLKNGDTNKVISICCWIRMESYPTSSQGCEIYAKYNATSQRCIVLGFASGTNNGLIGLSIGYNSGTSFESVTHATQLSLATWYHITTTFDNSDYSYTLRVKDTNGDTVGTDLEGNMTLDVNGISLNTYAVQIGCLSSGGTPVWYYDGRLDEMAIFDDVITATEATQIAQGVYGVAATMQAGIGLGKLSLGNGVLGRRVLTR
jgi:hypothetical protein